MQLSTFEMGECFRAFLLLVGYDGEISAEERELLLSIGGKLDFERRFCENAIDELLSNKYISRDPPHFSRRKIAEGFLQDGCRIALSDGELHVDELQWLTAIARANEVTAEWLEGVLRGIQKVGMKALAESPLALEAFISHPHGRRRS